MQRAVPLWRVFSRFLPVRRQFVAAYRLPIRVPFQSRSPTALQTSLSLLGTMGGKGSKQISTEGGEQKEAKSSKEKDVAASEQPPSEEGQKQEVETPATGQATADPEQTEEPPSEEGQKQEVETPATGQATADPEQTEEPPSEEGQKQEVETPATGQATADPEQTEEQRAETEPTEPAAQEEARTQQDGDFVQATVAKTSDFGECDE